MSESTQKVKKLLEEVPQEIKGQIEAMSCWRNNGSKCSKI